MSYAIGQGELDLGSFSFLEDFAVSGTAIPFCGATLIQAFYDDASETNPLTDTYALKPVRTDAGTPISNLYLTNDNVVDVGMTPNYKIKISLVEYSTVFAESEKMITY